MNSKLNASEDTVRFSKNADGSWIAYISVWERTFVGNGRDAEQADHDLWKQIRRDTLGNRQTIPATIQFELNRRS